MPSFFSPRKVASQYFEPNKYKDNLLIDGGLYDNQGAYILSEGSNSIYRTTDIIVSDAGNSKPSSKWVRNVFVLMYQSIEVLMNRIRTIQIRQNIYKNRNEGSANKPNFAYISLRWDNPQSMPIRFISNVEKGYVSQRILDYHNISSTETNNLINRKDLELMEELINKFKKSVDWETLINKAPTTNDYNTAYKVGTNLVPLSDKQIDSLVKYADWMTEVQIKTYLPYLLDLKN